MHLPRALLVAAVAAVITGAAGAAEPAGKLTPVRPEIYAPLKLSADLSGLTEKERQMLGLFIEAGEIMQMLNRRGVPLPDADIQRVHLSIRMMHGQIISLMQHGPGPWSVEDPILHEELARVMVRYLGLDR